jgi:two-component system, cell cycle sensor histidine kinase and response regulator CckA
VQARDLVAGRAFGFWPLAFGNGGWLLVAAGLSCLGLKIAGLVDLGLAQVLTGAALLAAGVGALSMHLVNRLRGDQANLLSFMLVAEDAAPCFSTTAQGEVVFRNQAAETRFGTEAGTLLQALGRRVASPSTLLFRMQKQAESVGAAREDVETGLGVMRLSVHRSEPGRFFWRVEEFHQVSNQEEPQPRVERMAGEAGSADLEEVPVALMTFGPDGVLRVANRAARDLMWQGEIRAAMFHDMFEGLGRPVSDWLADVVAGRLPGGSEVLRARRLGEETYLQVTLRRFVDGERLGALAVLNDATRLKTLEAQFNQSQKMQAIGQLAGGIAHDFNNLLTAISGHCDLLLLRHDAQDMDFSDLEQIRQNANRAAALVGQLLAFSRKQTLKPERLELEEVLSELTHLMNRLVVERVGLSLAHLGQQSGRPLKPIRADRRQLEQVLINLVVNARDAMPDGGRIRIETEPVTLVEDMKRDRASVPAGDYSVIRVIDDGTGIPEDLKQKIFEPFFTTKRVGEGTGLGLSMAYGIIKQSGGFIFVDSEPGKGTVFSVYLPVFEGVEPVVAPPEARRSSSKPGEGVILLVEDEAPVRAFAGRALRLRGYTVIEAATGEEALKTLEDRSLEVDVFVTDVVMPGMDGPAWVRKALEDRPGVRVIFVSGYAEDSLSEDQLRIPNSVFLPKPFSLNDLTSTVQGQMH